MNLITYRPLLSLFEQQTLTSHWQCSPCRQQLLPVLLDSGDVDSEIRQLCSGSCRWKKDEYGWAHILIRTPWEIWEPGDIKKYILVNFDRSIIRLQKSTGDNLAILSLRIVFQSQSKRLCKWKNAGLYMNFISLQKGYCKEREKPKARTHSFPPSW